MNIPSSQIQLKKKVGKADGKDITHIKTVGGLHVIVDHKGDILGAGPHKMVARHQAGKYRDITWTELSKSDHLSIEAYAHLLPEFEALTLEMRKMQGLKD